MTIAARPGLLWALCFTVACSGGLASRPAHAEQAEPPPPAAASRPEVEVEGKPRRVAKRNEPAKEAATAAEKPLSSELPGGIAGRGARRSALLAQLFGNQPVVSLKTGGQQPDMIDSLRLDEAVALALQNNFEVRAAGAKSDAADWEVLGAYGAYLPAVTWSRASGKERSAPASYSINDERVLDSKHHRRDRVWQVRQPIVDLTLISDILLRHTSQTATEIEQVSTRERIALLTVNSFYKIMQAQLGIRFAQEYKAQLDDLTQRMGLRVEGGGAAQADLDRIKTRLASAESAIIETGSAFDAAMDEFRRLTGVTPLKVEIPSSLVPAVPDKLDDSLAKAVSANPEYRLAEQQVRVQAAESEKSYSRMLPKLTFDLSDSRSWNAGGSALGASAAGGTDVYPYQNEKRAMLTVTWAINGGTDVAGGMAAAAKAREANYKAMDTRQRTEELVRVSYNALNAAQSRIGVLEQALQSNFKVVTAFEEQYVNGSRPLFDLLDAYERLYSARLDLGKVLFSEGQAGYQLRREMGELVEAVKESEPRIGAPSEDKP